MCQSGLDPSEGETVTLSADDIKALIAEFKDSSWEEMSLTTGDVSVVISRTAGSTWVGTTPPLTTSSERPTTRVDDVQGTAYHPPSVAPAATTNVSVSPDSSTPVERTLDTHTVISPTVGLFWRSPNPGSPPFVEVGQRVQASDIVAIVEVMKLMNSIEAGPCRNGGRDPARQRIFR